ncbi:MAG: ABC transporter ATP-binding protein, partial [Planctomycetota bacterium]
MSTPLGPTLLETKALCRYFGGVKANENVSISISSGSVTSLIGPNGAGKTTAFNAITGIFPPTTGEILLHRNQEVVSIAGQRPDQICKLGLARTFQNIHLFEDMPVVENVKVGLHCRTKRGVFASIFRSFGQLREEDEIHKAALGYLDFVGLGEFAHERATNLAYGDQRRLEIARALATHPTLLLLDEPAAGMNPTETATLMELIARIKASGVTVFLIEHDVKMVMAVSDYVYVMDHGELIAHGTPDVV